MKKVALAVLALAVIIIMPASAQSGVPVENALVVISSQDEVILQSILATGGSPFGIRKAIETGVLLRPASTVPSVSTDAAGQFMLDAPLNLGTYNIMVFAPGFVASSDSLSVDGNSMVKNLTIFMQPSAMVSGRVIDSQGRPVSGVVVAASSPHSANYDITMDDGVFVLDAGLKTGVHKIYAFKPGIEVDRLQELFNSTEFALFENKVPPALFKTEGGGYISQVFEVQLEQGKLTTMNVQLENSHVVSGKVIDSSGNPLQDIVVFVFDASGDMVDTMAITDSEGRYTLNNNLASGTYAIVIPSLFNKGYTPASARVSVPAENKIDFLLDKSAKISGRVTDSKGDPVVGSTVFAISKGLTNDTQLSQFLATSTATTKTDQEGIFTLDSGIGGGAYVVMASFGSLPVRSYTEVQAGGHADIILDFEETSVINGRVIDGNGKPIEKALVAPSFASTLSNAESFGVETNSDGSYELIVPIKNNSTRSLFDQVTAFADGYKSASAQRDGTIVLDKMPTTKITGTVIAQKPLSPPVETVLTRKGTVIFEHSGAQYMVGLQTNARVLVAAFDPPSKSISLNLEGVQDAKGRSEFSIPREFMSGPFVVTLDGRLAQSINTTENQTHSVIMVEHEHAPQQIAIRGATAVPEFSLPAALAAAGLAAILVWKRLKP